jgi:hypothetical protein
MTLYPPARGRGSRMAPGQRGFSYAATQQPAKLEADKGSLLQDLVFLVAHLKSCQAAPTQKRVHLDPLRVKTSFPAPPRS